MPLLASSLALARLHTSSCMISGLTNDTVTPDEASHVRMWWTVADTASTAARLAMPYPGKHMCPVGTTGHKVPAGLSSNPTLAPAFSCGAKVRTATVGTTVRALNDLAILAASFSGPSCMSWRGATPEQTMSASTPLSDPTAAWILSMFLRLGSPSPRTRTKGRKGSRELPARAAEAASSHWTKTKKPRRDSSTTRAAPISPSAPITTATR
mmetsp:Transcript_36945/g.104253  ORF Transcript_36945/g.104253 Transcript_36945/m.104253 type:complete len:211 (-) Transcript_36945:597-1229(-)